MPQPVLAFITKSSAFSLNPPKFFIIKSSCLFHQILDIMDFRRGLIGFALVLAVAALLHSATAETYTVLGAEGWSIPTTGNDGVYRTWAADKEFKVGDVLVFNFPTGAHDVTEVTKANYDSCGKTNSITTVTTGPANLKLTTAGMHYYICSFGQHCTAGQKLAVKVTAGRDDSNTRTPPPATSPPSTRTPPTTTTSTPPLPSSASSITFGCFSVAILSIVLVLLH